MQHLFSAHGPNPIYIYINSKLYRPLCEHQYSYGYCNLWSCCSWCKQAFRVDKTS